MSSLRTAQKQMTRSRLLASGIELFQKKGYAATTVDDIAAGAGATRSTFYLHFASKTQLMIALIDEINDKVVASDVPRLTQVVATGDRDQIRTWLSRRFDQWPEIMPYVTAGHQAAGTDPEIAAAVRRWLESAVDEIHAGLDQAGRFAPASRRVRAVLAFGQVEFLSRRWFSEGWDESVDRDATLQALTDTWHYLLLEPAA
ncbi:TetR/AcrR family transcriptional regulator [Streptomyces sp. NPDC085927]|uniref:TetR/AcrR family transcriptional regulator n=1 Tax=Streptomyces sp. NPDC085927 TaxID=3365738 RepID=UPI0037CFE1A0